MTDEYIEYLTENAQRAYPLTEDCVPSTAFANNIILDARGFSRDMPGDGIFLSAFSGYNSNPSSEWAHPSGYSSFFFTLGATAIARIDVPSSQSLGLPFKTTATVTDPKSSIAALAGIEVTIGPGFANLSPNSSIVFNKTAPLESSAIINLNRQQIDCIGIMHKDSNTVEFVEGNIVIRGGYNTEVLQNNKNISISAHVGAGELGQYYSGNQFPNACSGFIYSISGATPNQAGNIKFVARKGISITSEEHTVIISLETDSLNPPCI